jgi:c-di-GMP-binding flagellar brake protein YcgR
MNPTTAERRLHVRVPFTAQVDLIPLEGGQPLRARAADLSLRGVGLVAPRALRIGIAVGLVFHLPEECEDAARQQILGKVVSSDRVGDQNRIGVEFLPPLTARENPTLFARLASA